MRDRRFDHQFWSAAPGAMSTERRRSLEAAMMAVVIFLGIIAADVLV